jgi:hypothetical protein
MVRRIEKYVEVEQLRLDVRHRRAILLLEAIAQKI